LLEALRSGHLGGAAMDVFAEEPYAGPLIEMDNVLLTAHMGASAHQSRFLMELDAARDCVRVLGGEPPRSAVPFEEPAENASRTP
jgi:D-3-phosphoglycerate dehydrogenase